MSSYNGGATATARANHARADQTALRLVKGVDLDAFRATQPPTQTQVLLAEAFDLVRVGLRSVLEREGDIIVVGESRSGENLIALATELRPDVLLMDIRLPGLDALAAARQLRTHPELPQLRVVILAAAERTGDLVGAVRSGIDGFVSHGADPVDVVRAVRVVAAGGAYLSPRAARWLLDELAANLDFPQACSEQFEDLADRERELVLLAARGLSNAEIAERLAISPATVETHIGRAMAKLHTHGGAKLGALAYQSGFVKHYRATDAKMDRQPSASHLVDATQEMIARRRVIAAADEERRRVVRDLHDGAQQRLVEAMLVLRLALRRLEDADPEMRALVEEALRGTEQANSELRDLAHGILPPVLTRFGLKAALPALASRVAQARVVDVPEGRFPPTIEATAYFVVSEALTNAVKYASAGSITVSARVEREELMVEVADDGVGGADGACSDGLAALEDRVSALSGRLTVNSPRGEGTRVAAQLPLPKEEEASASKPLQRRCAPVAAESSMTVRVR